jgi:hypothetical protein
MLGQMIAKLGLHDVYDHSRSEVDDRQLGQMLASMAEGYATALGVKIDTNAIRASRNPFQSVSQLYGFLSASQGPEVGDFLQLGVWIVFYVSVMGGYPIKPDGGISEVQAEALRQRFLNRVTAARIDPRIVHPLLAAVKAAGRIPSGEIDAKRTGEAVAADIAALIQKQETEASTSATGKICRILFLAANPTDETRLRLDEEMRGIDEVLRQSKFRDSFEIAQHWAVRVSDLQGYLLRHAPDVVHFSGHGSTLGEIYLEDNYGKGAPVTSRALASTFSILKDSVHCVVLNACYSKAQAEAIAANIDFVVGMSASIGDRAAITFSRSFYQAVGYRRSVKEAFELARSQIDMENLEEQDVPQLIATARNPAEYHLLLSS